MLLLRRATRPLRQQLCCAANTSQQGLRRATRPPLGRALATAAPQPIHDALRQVLENGTQKKKRKFDESVDLDVTLNVDPRKPLQAVRGVVSLPHGYGHDLHGVELSVAARKPGVNANAVVDDVDLDVPSGTSVLNGVAVEVRAVPGI